MQGQWAFNAPPGNATARLPALTSGGALAGLRIVNDGTTWQGGCPGLGPPPGAPTWGQLNVAAGRANHSGAALCGVRAWVGGSYANSWDNGDLFSRDGQVPSALAAGRVQVVNYANYSAAGGAWVDGGSAAGEGMYTCANGGACVGPDACMCDSGFSGFDCSVPVCLNTSWGTAAPAPTTGQQRLAQSGCFNGGICVAPETCACPTLPALLPSMYPLDMAPGQSTGWASVTVVGGWQWAGRSLPGPTPPDTPLANQAPFAAQTLTLPGIALASADCSMPICTQGWYNASGCPRTPVSTDAFLTSQASTTGCFQCPNGGRCTCVCF